MMLLYNIFLCVGAVLALPVLLPTVLRSRKRRKTVRQRLGMTRMPLSGPGSRRRIWVHALSVGEVISSVPLVSAIREAFPEREIFFSASTLTGFETARREFQGGITTLFYFPYDLMFSVKRILGAVNPEALVIVETDLWPNFLFEAARRGIPVFLVNSRLSDKSFAGYRRFRFFFKPVFDTLIRICTQTRVDADRFRRLGVAEGKIAVTGNVKFDNPIEPLSKADIDALRQQSGIGPDRRVWVAGSTHDGEEAILLAAFKRLRRSFKNLFLIVAPRNPDRAPRVCDIARGLGLFAAALSAVEADLSGADGEVLVVDRIGLLKRLYGLGEAAFVGGSLVDLGGHNFLEPAAHGKPVLFGPHVSAFTEISRMLLQAGGAVQVSGEEDLHNALAGLLADPFRAREMGRRGRKVFERNRGSVDRTVSVIREQMGP
ncbi:MAG: 3-deoxy-D-manno-octulosonic acid transferase [Desulfococcaceae bacterium]